jgi:hypothetical protein
MRRCPLATPNVAYHATTDATQAIRWSQKTTIDVECKQKFQLLQTPGIEPGTVCAANGAHVATIVRQKS